MRWTAGLLAITILLASCAPSLTQEVESAKQTVITYFDLLSKGEYAAADALYGGDYEALASVNPVLDPADHAALWQNGCHLNGWQCLSVRSAILKEQHGDVFTFLVEFNNSDGSLFVRGPCCGASETEMPPESTFEFRVIKSVEGHFKVLDLPVFVP